MTIVSEGGREARSGKAKLRSVPKASEPKPAKKKVKAELPAKADVEPEATSAPVDTTPIAGSLAALSEAYLVHLEKDGKSPGTIASYGAELVMAMRELGAETLVKDLTVESVRRFYDCDAVMLLRTGAPKSILSIAKSRRVLRHALVFAAYEGWIPTAPLPE